MDFKHYLTVLFPLFILYGCGCDDQYSSPFHLIVPIHSITTSDTISIGDTIWVDAEFSKQVELYNQESSIWLDSFQFFTDLVISELTGPESDYSYAFDVFSSVGKISILPIANTIGFPIQYQEDDDTYRFKGGVILNTPGIYYLSFSTNRQIIGEDYMNHPAL